MPQPEELLGELCRQPDLQSARDFLAAHPSLIDETYMRIVYLSAQELTDRKIRERLEQFSDLLQKAIEKGLDAAYGEMAGGPPRRLQGFELIQLGSQFLEAREDAALALLQQYPEFPIEATIAIAQALTSRASPEEKQRRESRIAILTQWPRAVLAGAMRAAQQAEEQYGRAPGVETLRGMARAIEAVAASPGIVRMEPKMRAEILARDASVQYRLWTSTYDPDILDLAIARGTEAATLLPGTGIDFLTGALIERYEARGTAEDLDSAVTLLQSAIPGDRISAGNLPQAVLATNLANALRHRHIVTGVPRDADRAVTLYEQLAALPAAEPERKRIRLLNLSSGLMTCYDNVGDLADLNRAIDISRSCLQEMADEEPGKTTVANNLGLALMKRFPVTKDGNDLATAQGA
ncbi:MAG: hypothetical protein NTW28_36275, partial [Candidatus Solibacter sp.]|nr:hypothetical protein [Candidatus Solibacter sp.]